MNRHTQTGSTLVIWLIIAVILAGGLIVVQLQRPTPPPAVQQATLLPIPKPLTDFDLIDHHGKPFTQASVQGRWSLLFFGYTHCPDICPTTMHDLNGLLKVLGQDYPDSPLPRVVFVSVDPERDTVERLQSYVPYFNEQFLGVTGETAKLVDFSRQLNAFFRYVKETPDAQDYVVDHSAAVSLIDPLGQLHAIFSPPLKPREIAGDYAAITEHFEETR